MNNIRQELSNLKPFEREQLKYAHQYNISQYIKLPNNRFIGVHCATIRHLIIEESTNDWYIGRIQLPNGDHKDAVDTATV